MLALIERQLLVASATDALVQGVICSTGLSSEWAEDTLALCHQALLYIIVGFYRGKNYSYEYCAQLSRPYVAGVRNSDSCGEGYGFDPGLRQKFVRGYWLIGREQDSTGEKGAATHRRNVRYLWM